MKKNSAPNAANNSQTPAEPQKHSWNITAEILQRELGLSSAHGGAFTTNCVGSKYIVQRMQVSHRLQTGGHKLNFSSTGSLICVAKTEDISVVDWAKDEKKFRIPINKTVRISDVAFLNPGYRSDTLKIVSTNKNGLLRYDIVTPAGEIASSDVQLLSNEKYKLALCPNKEYELLAASASGNIFNIDLRERQVPKFTVAAETLRVGQNVKLQAISHHPLAPQICASYDDYFVRVFDKRNFDEPLHEIRAENLRSKGNPRASNCIYSYDGSEILANHEGEKIYVFDSENPQPGKYKQAFNSRGMVGFTNRISFFGPKSEYVIIGDDGQWFTFYETKSGNFMKSICLNPRHARFCSVFVYAIKAHPHLPVVAASIGRISMLSPSSSEEHKIHSVITPAMLKPRPRPETMKKV